VAGLLFTIIPQILEQVGQLARELPNALNAAGNWLSERTGIERNDEVAARANDQIAEFVGRFVPVAVNLVATLVGSTAVVILAIFLAYSPETYRGLLIRLTPPAARPQMERVYEEAG